MAKKLTKKLASEIMTNEIKIEGKTKIKSKNKIKSKIEKPHNGLTEKKLAKKLIEKHQTFVENYKKEFDIFQRISILKEKQDQLEHWLCSENNLDEDQKYFREMELADKELLKLNRELEKLYDSDSDSNKILDEPRKRYNWLKKKISEHEDSMKYWKERYGDLTKKGAKVQ